MVKKLTALLLLGAGVLLILIIQWPDDKLRLIFCDVGQGDAILMTYKNYQVLVDSGPDNSVLTCLGRHMQLWDREIEAVITTHEQKDHNTGLKEIAKRYAVNKISPTSTEIKIGQINLKQLSKPIFTDKNADARVWQGSFGNFDWLLTADIGVAEEKQLLAELGPVEVLKVAHHGSKYSSTAEFLARIKPGLAVISVGKNHYGHPTKEVLDRLQAIGARILRTDQAGEVVVVSDGKKWYVK
ncbi:MAG: hypothetical protein AAB580_00990 [Patescibacteria group bacterium]